MKKTQLFENRNILKRVLSWMLLFSIVISTVPVQAAGTTIVLSDIVDGLAGAQHYGTVANQFTQYGHAETNVFTDQLYKDADAAFLTSVRGLRTYGDFSIVADLKIYGPHAADPAMKFGLFRKTSSGYEQVSTDTVTISVPADTTNGVWSPVDGIEFSVTDISVKQYGLYVLQIEDNRPVLNNKFNNTELKVNYGDSTTGEPIPITASENSSYVGSIEMGPHMQSEWSSVKMMQSANDDGGKYYTTGYQVEFGPNISLYRRINNTTTYEKITSDYPDAVDKVYIRDSDWPAGMYREFSNVAWVPGNGTEEGYWTNCKDPVDFKFNVEKSAASTLSSCLSLSETLATAGGGTMEKNTPVSSGSNGTVFGPEENGKVVTFYTYTVPSNNQIAIGNLRGLPISDNEYVVVNVICPSRDGTITTGNNEAMEVHTSKGLVSTSGWQETPTDPPEDTSVFSRIIWNFVYEDGGTYKPFEGTITNTGSLGGMYLAPKANINMASVGNAVSFVANKVANGIPPAQEGGYPSTVEIHQTTFNADTEKHFAITMKPLSTEIALTGTKSMTGRDLTSTDVFRFTVRDENGATVTYGENSIVPGTINFKTIVYGVNDIGTHTYTITEDEPTDSSIIKDPSTKVVKVVVSMNTTTNELTANVVAAESSTLSFVNKVSGYLQVLKIDKADNNKKLSGAEFAIYPDSSCTVGTEVTTLVTGTDGTAISGKLPAGTYWIKETQAPAGYTIDDTTGQEISITANHTITAPLTKTYTDTEQSTCIQIYASKDLEGLDDTTTDFSFELTTTDAPMPDGDGNKVTVKAGKTGAFGGITFTYADLGGEESTIFTYVVKEVIPATKLPGVKYDTNEYTVTVTLEYKNGELTVSTDPGTLQSPVVITNTYEAAPVDVILHAAKTVEGKDDSGAEFTFTLAALTMGAPVADPAVISVKAGASGTFGKLTFESDGDYTYTITETDGKLKGYTYDIEPKTVIISVEDDHNGHLIAKVEGDTGFDPDTNTQTIVNTYEAKGSITFDGDKTLTGRELTTGDEFSFTVKEGSNVVATGHSDETGKITFTAIEYVLNDKSSDLGEHTYVITEDDTSLKGITKDGSEKTVTVVVTDNGDGTLSADIKTGSDTIRFINKAELKGSITFEGDKVLTGRELTTGDEFSFTVTENGKSVAYGHSDETGKITFTEIKYVLNDKTSDLGEHTYIITEDDTNRKGVTKDDSELTVKVLVTNNNDGTLKADIVSGSDTIRFVNAYEAKGSITFNGDKTMTGRELTTGDEFSFTVKEGTKTVATGKSDKNGVITFTTIEYVQNDEQSDIGEHTYIITENDTGLKGVTKDGSELTVKVIVTDKGDGTLKAELTTGSDAIKFVNKYAAKGSITFGGEKSIDGRPLMPGDEFSFTVKEGSTVVATGRNDSTGKITFTEIKYVLNDETSSLGEHTYTITEDKPTVPDVDGSEKTYTVKVTVSDNADGTLKVVSSGDDCLKLNFVNKQIVTKVQVTKSWVGGEVTDISDSLKLYALEGTEKSEVADPGFTPDAALKIYTSREVPKYKPGTSTTIDYVITEVKPEGYEVSYANTSGMYTPAGGMIVNNAYPKFHMRKTDANDPNLGLENAKYSLFTDPECTTWKADLITDANGDATLDELEYGVYYLKEQVAPENYAVSDDTYAVIYTSHADHTETFGIYTDEDCTQLLSDSPASLIVTDEYGTGQFELSVGSTGGVTVYVARESDKDAIKAGTKAPNTVSLPSNVLAENNGKLFIHLNKSNVHDYKLIYVDFGAEKSVTGTDPAAADFTFTLTAVDDAPSSELSTVTISYPVTNQGYFGRITYGKPGVYDYKVKETIGKVPGYTYDGKEHSLTVTVVDDGTGVLVPTATFDGKSVTLEKDPAKLDTDHYSNLMGIELVNKFSLIARTQMKASKTLTGRELTGGEFSFTLKSKAGTGTPGYEETVTNGKEGSVTFSEIVYDGASHQGKTYTYELAEVQTNMSGYTLDDTVYEIDVKLSDDMQTVTQTFYKVSGGTRTPVDAVKFVNAYEAKGSITFNGDKSLTGRELTTGDEFSFTVTEDGKTVAYGHSDETGKITFTTIEYALNDKTSDLGEHTYIITEDDTSLKGITKDGSELTVKVMVTDSGDGTLKAELLSTGDEISFVNAYEAKGSITFDGVKKLEGRELTVGDEFSFTVTEDGKTVATGHSDETGKITFTEIEYVLNDKTSDLGEHTYIVTENDTSLKGITKDGSELTVKVMVTDNGDGTLKAEPLTTSDKLEFVNKYEVSGKITLTGSKALTGRELTVGDEYSFTVKEGSTVVATGKNDLTGKITFSDIIYHLEDEGTHVYTVTEDVCTVPGVTGDDAVLTVTVKVTSNTANVTMDAEIINTESDELAFQNAYEASGCVIFTGNKALTGRELTVGDEFSFTVTEDGKSVAYGHSDETGKITFTTIEYVLNDKTSDLGEHTYIVTEDDTNLPGITKDGSELTVKVMVTDNGDGTLKAEIISGGDEITFTNMYRATGTVDPKAVKYVDRVGAVPGTDEKFDFYLEKEDGSRITVQNNENGVADFGLLEYTEKDIGETFVYTMREKQMVNGAFVTDPTVYIMTVDVEDNGDGTLNPVAILERVSADGTRTDVKDDEEIVFLNERKTSIHITKEWEGGEEDEIVLILYANGKQVPETETVTDPETGKPVDKINYVLDREGYRYTFSQLAPNDADGNPITYGVKEKGVSGYMRIYRNVGEYKNKSDYIYDGGTVINRAVTSIRVKKVWEGIDDESKRPAITLTLYCNGSVYNKQPSGPDKDGWYRWNNLPTVYGGRDAVYYVVEEPVEGFETTYSNTGMHSDVTDRAYNGGTITNSGVPATGDSTPVVLMGGLLGMSILGVILILRKKKTNK